VTQDWLAPVISAQQGDLAAFDRIVQRFQDMAVAYAYSLLGDFGAAEDAAQEAFVRAYMDLPILREPGAFPAWLRRIVFKQCDRVTRKRRPQTLSLDAEDDLPDGAQGPLETLQQRETHDAVLAAVNALPENERAATALFYINGYSLAEVGEFLEAPVSTVKFRLHSARKRLRERMASMVEGTMRQHAPGDDLGRRVRQVLEGVPRVGYDVHCCPFPGSLVACMAYLGDPCSYDYLMGVTGAAFRRLWNRDDGGNIDTMYFAPEPHARAFRALGYTWRAVPKDKAEMTHAIRESIDRGIPAIAFGIIGPPEAGIVTGYDKEGQILLGFSYFQEHSQRGYYEKAGWFESVEGWGPYGLIVIGKKTDRPPERETLRSTLAWAVDLAHMPGPRPDTHTCGLAAYESWAAGLEVDADYPAGDAKALGWRAMVHGDQTQMLDERKNGAGYLRSMVEVAPEVAAGLQAAAALYDQVAGEMPGVWKWGYSMGPEVGQGLADPALRRDIARHVRRAGELEARAVAELEKALTTL
jgi:RNA polymerase sigma factor (sigma-70 family)